LVGVVGRACPYHRLSASHLFASSQNLASLNRSLQLKFMPTAPILPKEMRYQILQCITNYLGSNSRWQSLSISSSLCQPFVCIFPELGFLELLARTLCGLRRHTEYGQGVQGSQVLGRCKQMAGRETMIWTSWRIWYRISFGKIGAVGINFNCKLRLLTQNPRGG
jgi:hypothetical protein